MFYWDNFDISFIHEILQNIPMEKSDEEVWRYSWQGEDKEGMIAVLNDFWKEPNRKFILSFRTIIEQKLLKYYPEEVNKICRALKISGKTFDERQMKMQQKTSSPSLIQAYIIALKNISGKDIPLNEYSKFRNTLPLNMKETDIPDVPLYDYQEKAVKKLQEHFVQNDKESGILVMPTGSGKSRTASYFLIRDMISRGYQILWIAHRHMLLEQAAECFYDFAGLSKIKNPDMRQYRITCVSGRHQSIKSIGKYEVVIASISSICRSKEHLRRILGSKVMIVVDECHHTLAPSYQNTISFIKKCRKQTKLLGLTATPIRANDQDTMRMRKIYDDTCIYSISMAELIKKGILASPTFYRVSTGENFEPIISVDEEKLLKKYGELPETLINKIAGSNSRNKIILQQYLDHADEYGKTLIFAMNVTHCKLLCHEFKKKHISCGMVYSGKDDNNSIIQQFREGKFQVLINVNIMTEGTDVPDIQTVFLTRPTSSEGLLMQMIGRGMRGLYAHGTEKVNIIDFHDQWETYNKWLNPEWLIEEELESTESEIVSAKKQPAKEAPDWKMCLDIYKSIRFAKTELSQNVAIPYGWYSLTDDDGRKYSMLVFENQVEPLSKMINDFDFWSMDGSVTGEDMLDKYFCGFEFRPSVSDVELLMENLRMTRVAPELHILEDREKVEPAKVIKMAEEQGTDIFKLGNEIYDQNPIIRELYDSKEAYVMELCRFKVYGDKNPILGSKVEELPVEFIPFDRTPFYDLDQLVKEVKKEMFHGRYPGIKSVRWTDKAYKSYYGKHYEDHSIMINSVLNSKDVPKEVVKFVIYHELLHRDYWNHDSAFREKEHLYPSYEECEHFLYDNMVRFDIKEW